MGKIMLMCFIINICGRKFYERLGFEVDEKNLFRERKLRGGKIVKLDYVILSWVEEGDGVVVEVGGGEG